MFLMEDLKKKQAAQAAQLEEIPDDDAGIMEIMKYNSKRLFREYLGTETKRKIVLDVVCFSLACFALKNYGDLLSV